jgi:hypothetical protein
MSEKYYYQEPSANQIEEISKLGFSYEPIFHTHGAAGYVDVINGSGGIQIVRLTSATGIEDEVSLRYAGLPYEIKINNFADRYIIWNSRVLNIGDGGYRKWVLSSYNLGERGQIVQVKNGFPSTTYVFKQNKQGVWKTQKAVDDYFSKKPGLGDIPLRGFPSHEIRLSRPVIYSGPNTSLKHWYNTNDNDVDDFDELATVNLPRGMPLLVPELPPNLKPDYLLERRFLENPQALLDWEGYMQQQAHDYQRLIQDV